MRRFYLAPSLIAMTYIPPKINHAVCGAGTEHKHADTFCELSVVRTYVKNLKTFVQRTNLTSV